MGALGGIGHASDALFLRAARRERKKPSEQTLHLRGRLRAIDRLRGLLAVQIQSKNTLINNMFNVRLIVQKERRRNGFEPANSSPVVLLYTLQCK